MGVLPDRDTHWSDWRHCRIRRLKSLGIGDLPEPCLRFTLITISTIFCDRYG